MEFFVLLTVLVFASKNENDFVVCIAANSDVGNYVENPILVKIEEDEDIKKQSSQHIGVTYDDNRSKWRVRRWSKKEHKNVHKGSYRDEETAAHASDTLARQLMASGEKDHKLNFPNDNTEVHPEEKYSKLNYIGVYFNAKTKKWIAQRWSKTEKQLNHNGTYRDEKTAARASDTLARQLMINGEKKLKLNFPDDISEVHPEEKKNNSKYIGVYYAQDREKWRAKRWSTNENKYVDNGYYKDKENAARASDTLARKLMANGKQNLELNFPNEYTEMHKRTKISKYFGISYNGRARSWIAQRYSKTEKRLFSNGYHNEEETAAHASDTLARQLRANGEINLKLNFPDDNTEVHSKNRENKRKRLDFENSQKNEKNSEKFEEKEK